ncbi:DUF6428 family protein [Neolewinella litorea]|uniref:Uncharacterized protein n=1 Tax=Neolewinella litorea TaxID=2562452 RepID=A0A4S4NLB9_9BACT|nr:DUF6428 family protein [Neolewinella litorea]THH39677.1 hypothetical protein E4021_08650 [Neolewinella litorea]
MKVSELKHFLRSRERFTIALPDGARVPGHFHVTEVGEVTKNFIDCGGTLRRQRAVSLQLWAADDYDHRLAPGKLIHILELAEAKLGLGDLPLEVEYQGAVTVEKFGLEERDGELQLTSLVTDCLAREACGVPTEKFTSLSAFTAATAGGCTPGSGCC